MKKLFWISILAIGTCFSAIQAQNNIGYLNALNVLYTMPEIRQVQADLQDYSAELDKELMKVYLEYRGKDSTFQTDFNKWSPTIQKLKKEELDETQQKLQRTQQALEQDLMEKQQILIQPLLTKIDSAIKVVAKNQSLNYVFDLSKNALLFADESGDITKQVKTILGIDPNAKPEDTMMMGDIPMGQ